MPTLSYQISVPVAVLYSLREDRSISVDAISVPSEDEVYDMVGKHAKDIKALISQEIAR